MNHYDDLQRFKEKTRTRSLKFKDLSSEAAAGEKGDWVILNQLIPAEEESSLAMGGSVSLPVPQSIVPPGAGGGSLPICFIRWSALSFKPPLRHLRRRQR